MKVDILKKKATGLRQRGFSFREISEKIGIAKSTASLWTRSVKLSTKARQRIEILSINGRKKSVEVNQRKRKAESEETKKKVEEYFSNLEQSKINPRLACALLYWGEGTKYVGNKSVSFMNADPEMIKYFLRVFRESFDLEEKKFRALIHLHEYHNIKKQLKFWSDITKIPLSQFNRSYLKKNTGKNKRENYPGCICIRYSDIKIYKELMFTIEKLAKV